VTGEKHLGRRLKDGNGGRSRINNNTKPYKQQQQLGNGNFMTPTKSHFNSTSGIQLTPTTKMKEEQKSSLVSG